MSSVASKPEPVEVSPDHWSEPSSTVGPKVIIGLAAVAMAVLALIDALIPSGIALPVLYTVPVVFAARTRSTRVVWSFIATAVVLTFTVHFAGGPPNGTASPRMIWVNGLLSSATLVAVGAITHQRIATGRRLDHHTLRAREQRSTLETLNEELSEREEEIVRQNEELQSQTEELERQTEELRVTNEDLASRERFLEQLVELSRSLTSDLKPDEVRARVCESLGRLSIGTAAAVLERRDHHLEVICHHGLGAPLKRKELPIDGSLAGLVLSMGQTAFVEDLKRRPDLIVPQPASGLPFVSVLSAPIRISNRAIGTIEAYTVLPHAWTDSQVATIESVAAQLSVSVQNAQLIEDVREHRRRFEAAFRSVPVGMAIAADPAGNDIRFNPAGALALGMPLGENVSTWAGAVLMNGLFQGGRVVSPNAAPLARALAGEEIRAEEYELALIDGRRLSLVVSAAPFRAADGSITGAVTAFLDVSNYKQLLREVEIRRREAEEASVRKTRFLAAVSHDLRTPANAINLVAEIIRNVAREPGVPPEMSSLAERLQRNVITLLSLVGDLLDLSRFDSGKIEVIESEFSLNDLLVEEGEQLRPLAGAKSVDLVVDPGPRPIWLRTDRVKLARVIGNVVDNAIKFTAEGSVRVTIASLDDERSRAGVEIHIVDTGIGIPAEQIGHIFDEFVQLRNAERDATKGTGLGLAICHRLVAVLGGEIQVQSTPSAGSRFIIRLPASAIAVRLGTLEPLSAPRPEPSRTERRRLEGLRILLVEDHASTRESCRDLLIREGAVVREAPDGSTALQFLYAEPVDVMLLDLMLPDMDGSEVLKCIRDTRPSGLRGVLVLSGDLNNERIPTLEALKPDAVILKPVNVDLLITAVQAFRVAPPSAERH